MRAVQAHQRKFEPRQGKTRRAKLECKTTLVTGVEGNGVHLAGETKRAIGGKQACAHSALFELDLV